jgi:hypothetical protein
LVCPKFTRAIYSPHQKKEFRNGTREPARIPGNRSCAAAANAGQSSSDDQQDRNKINVRQQAATPALQDIDPYQMSMRARKAIEPLIAYRKN